MLKYFIDKNGQETKRIAGRRGCGHIEIALSAEKLDSSSDIYRQMAALKYIRVIESASEIHVDAPKGLTRKQKIALEDLRATTSKAVCINSPLATESRASIKEQQECLGK